MSGITNLTACEVASAVAAGKLSAVDVVKAYLAAIERLEPTIQAYNEIFPELALERAKQIDSAISRGESAGPMAGVPVALKDVICTDFGKTTCSSKILANFKAPYSAFVADRLLSAGAIIIGKANMDEFAMGSSTENSATKTTRNPWDTSRVPGGSSGGSAAAVSAGLAAAALGSDTGGSVRQPAGLCGVVGMKPTYGRISRYGLIAYGSSLDQIGPFTHDTADCALLLRTIAGHDGRDSTSLPDAVPDYLAELETPLKNLRVGLPKEFFNKALDGEIRSAIDKVVEVYKSLGASVVEVTLPHSRIDIGPDGQLSSFAVACYYIVATAEASSNLARYDGAHYGHRTGKDVQDIVDMYSKSRAEGFGDEVKRRIMLGTYVLSSGYYDAYYLKAMKVRRLIKNDFDAAFKSCDLIVCPTSPTTAFRIGEKTDDPIQMYLADIYTISLNLAGLPGISIPAGLAASGLPIGMQLVGPVLSENLLLRAARMYEKASKICNLRPKMVQS